MQEKIRTSGKLREILGNAIIAVQNGTMDCDKARNITKLASQINESFYAEIKIAKVQTELGDTANKLGTLPLNMPDATT